MIGTYHGVRVWFNLDGCGIMCVLATWGMLLYSVYVIAFIVLRPTPLDECLSASRVLTSLAFAALAGLTATAHVRTMLTDPGSVPRHAAPLPTNPSREEASYAQAEGMEGNEGDIENLETSRLTARIDGMSVNDGDMDHDDFVGGGRGGGGRGVGRVGGEGNGRGRGETGGGARENSSLAATNERTIQPPAQPPVKWCHKCDAFKPPRAHHCSLCQRCIVKMDHHCPWVNNCVGIRNQKLFLLFCSYTCALCAFALLIMGVERIAIGDSGHKEACRMKPTDDVATVALSAMAILFGLFTCCMACDQCQVVSSNQTKIDRLKGELHASGGATNEVFGGDDDDGGGVKCRCHWLIPVPARFPAGEKAARIFGYYCIDRNGTVDDGRGSGGKRRRRGMLGSIIARKRDDVEMAEYGGVPGDEVELEEGGPPLGVGLGGRYVDDEGVEAGIR